MSKFCTNCGQELAEGTVFCTNCGARVDDINNTSVNTSNPNVVTANDLGQGGQYRNNVSSASKSNGLAIAGFVTSLVSSLLCCGALNPIALILSIIGLSKSKDYNGGGKGLAIAGIIISSILLILYIIIGLFSGFLSSVIEEL